MAAGRDLTETPSDAPPRGRRPRNRREIILSAATELFRVRGYAGVSMSEIAAATNIGPSAIYRHFSGKRELLVAAIDLGIDRYLEALETADPGIDLRQILRRLSECSLEYRALGVLWQREARNLAEEERRPLRDKLITISRLISHHLVAARPTLGADEADTLSWCVMGVLVSVGFHSASLEHEQFAELLVDLCLSVASVELPLPSTRAEMPSTTTTHTDSRRESLIAEATVLFAERGFAAAGLDEIGSAAGIAGPSIYGHFPSKQDLLVAVVEHGTAALQAATAEVLDADLPPSARLTGLVDSYVASINQNRSAIRILLSEMGELPEPERLESLRTQREYVDRWVHLVRDLTGVSDPRARIRVQAALLVINDAVQTPHIRSQPGFEATIGRIAKALVEVDDRVDSP